MDKKPKLNPTVAAVLLVVTAVPLSTAAFLTKTKSVDTNMQSVSTNADTFKKSGGGFFSQDNNVNLSDISGPYKNGTYDAIGSYFTPGGKEQIGVKVTIENNMIKSAMVNQMSKSNESSDYQARFASGYKKLVVGKKVDDVSISRVSGSSLTSNGFKTALNDIKKDAKA